MTLHGIDGAGRKLTEEEMIASIKLFCQGLKKEEDFEYLAKQVNFDTDKAVNQLVRARDSTQLQIGIHYEEEYESEMMPVESKKKS